MKNKVQRETFRRNSGMKQLFLFAIVFLPCMFVGFSGCSGKHPEEIRVACVGDSITYGEGLRDRVVSNYPAQLQKMLGNRWDVRNFGVSNTGILRKGDVPYWDKYEFKAAQGFNPNIVIIMLGTNDIKPENWKYKKDFIADYKSMITQFKALPSKPVVIVCSPVPLFKVIAGLNNALVKDALFPRIHNVASDEAVQFVDLYSVFEDRRSLFPDGIHPDNEGAGLIAQELYQVLISWKKAHK